MKLDQNFSQFVPFEATGEERVAIVASTFNWSIVDNLVSGALACLAAHGIPEKSVKVYYAPGALELPILVQRLARKSKYDAFITLGVVIRGETPHFDYVANHSSASLQRVALDEGIPVMFGVLTCDTTQQALDRAIGKEGNKGWEVAGSMLALLTTLREVDSV